MLQDFKEEINKPLLHNCENTKKMFIEIMRIVQDIKIEMEQQWQQQKKQKEKNILEIKVLGSQTKTSEVKSHQHITWKGRQKLGS